MPGTGGYGITTRATGTVLTATIYNTDHQNHVDNQDAQHSGGYSSNVSQMQTATDPGLPGTESLATSIAGELERLRAVISRLHGGTYWYSQLGNIYVPKGYIDGYTLTRASTTTITFGIGITSDSTGTVGLKNTAASTKTLQNAGAWAAGTGNNGLFTGARAANTWYHCFVIRKDSDGTLDFGFDTSVIAANRPAGYTYFKRVGSIQTDATPIINNFAQYPGGEFSWGSFFTDINIAGAPTTFTLATMHTPPGVNCIWRGSAYVNPVAQYVQIANGDGLGIDTLAGIGDAESYAQAITDTSSRIQYKAQTGGGTVQVYTHGWKDFRGRDS